MQADQVVEEDTIPEQIEVSLEIICTTNMSKFTKLSIWEDM